MNKKLLTYITIAVGAALAFFLSDNIPYLGRSLIAIILGMIIRYTPLLPHLDAKTLKFVREHVLRFGIVLLGFDLSLQTLSGIGISSLPYIFVYIFSAFFFAMLFGKMMKVNTKTSFLIGTGAAICGGSAILTIAPLIDTEDEDLAFALATISVSNIVALVVFPIIGALLNLSETQFGLFAGGSIKDVASVVAVSMDYGSTAGEVGTIVKLTRVLMLVLLVIGVTIYNSRKQSQATSEDEEGTPTKQKGSIISSIPRFVIWFILVIIFVSIISLPEAVIDGAGTLSAISLTLALVGIGINTDFKSILKNGLKPVILGEISWYAASAILLVLVLLFSA